MRRNLGRRLAAPLVVFLLPPTGAARQHEHAASPYAHLQTVEGSSLTPTEIGQLRAGEGMGLALPAELNHYPGPKHVLELAAALDLSTAQETRIREIRAAMTAAAIAKGEQIIVVDIHLGQAFRDGTIDAESLATMTGHLAALRGELQAIHLSAHLTTRAELSREQIQRYDELRGYASPEAAAGRSESR